MAKQAPKHSVCPDCGSKMVPIVYGYPSSGMWDQSLRGEVVLGGCCISGFDPTHQCEQGHRWRWDDSRTALDPRAAAGVVVPSGRNRARSRSASGWVSMSDVWGELDLEDVDDDPEQPLV